MSYKKLLGVAVAVSFASTAWAADHGPTEGKFYLSPFGHFYAVPEDIGLDDDVQLGAGIGVGYAFTERMLAEISYLRSEHDIDGSSRDADTEQGWLDFLYKLDTDRSAFTPYLVGGVSRVNARFGGGLPKFTDNQVSAGIGLFSNMNDRFSVRGEVRGVHATDEGGLQPFARIGLTAMLGAIESSRGPVDSDGDGVYNADDRCPNTSAGTAVGPDGCELAGPGDADGDGVSDDMDRCPSTPAGVAVDSRGCARDGDGDGVPDHRDQCPDSEAGARVDEVGCYVELEQQVTIDMNLQFDTNSANLRSDHYAEIQRVVDFLRQYPTANAVIEGHTDASGPAAYNQNLSEKRAASVRDYLVNQADVDAARLSSRGYGETRPIATNDTAEGRAQNRRVSAVVEGTQTVRQ